MWEQIFAQAASNGLWALLFCVLLVYQLKESRAREQQYRQIIKSLSGSVESVKDIEGEIKEIGSDIKSIDAGIKEIKAQIRGSIKATGGSEKANGNIKAQDNPHTALSVLKTAPKRAKKAEPAAEIPVNA